MASWDGLSPQDRIAQLEALVFEMGELLRGAIPNNWHEVGGQMPCTDPKCDDLHRPPGPCWGQRVRAVLLRATDMVEGAI